MNGSVIGKLGKWTEKVSTERGARGVTGHRSPRVFMLGLYYTIPDRECFCESSLKLLRHPPHPQTEPNKKCLYFCVSDQ